MGSKWKTSFLTDHYIISSGLSKPAKDFGTGYPFLSFKDIFYNYFLPDSLTQLVQSTDKERATCSVRRGDVFLTRTSETMHELGMSSVALKDYADATFNGFCKRLRPKESSELEPEYVGYYLRSPIFRQGMLAFSTMSTRASLNNEMISRLEISYPDRKTQKKIANTLLSLDKKIALSRAINQTLEQISQTLFKSWFVDFDPVIDNALDAGNPIPEALQSRAELRQKVRNSENFKPLPADIRTLFPAEFEETELGWVPRDWYYVPLKNLGKIICGKTPDKSNKEYYGKDYLFIKIPDMHGKVFVTNSTDKLSTLGSETQIKKLIPKGSICVSCIATVGIVAINSKDCHTNQQINSIVPNSSILRNYLYFSMLEKNKTFHDLASGGSATLNMNTGIFSNVLTLKPEDSVLERFQQTSEHWFGRILANENEIHTLTALRDTLLPKLISGELSLEDLPNLVTQTEPA
ncbi:TPA: restriction endonuclease subunit S [Klebsiella aerogenes]|nr:restriction endonuclease subunit S [Klebsiella aerogenes]HDU4715608.1 restriction endonuclease subunit S [Klebsiella aerogenes]